MSDIDLTSFRPAGSTYSREHDHARLSRQQQAVWECMKDGNWRSLLEIAAATGEPEASVSARLRDFSRLGFTKERRARPGIDRKRGVWEYRVTR
jgi:hypothetical protein